MRSRIFGLGADSLQFGYLPHDLLRFHLGDLGALETSAEGSQLAEDSLFGKDSEDFSGSSEGFLRGWFFQESKERSPVFSALTLQEGVDCRCLKNVRAGCQNTSEKGFPVTASVPIRSCSVWSQRKARTSWD